MPDQLINSEIIENIKPEFENISKKMNKKKKYFVLTLFIFNLIIPGILITTSVHSLNNFEDTVYSKKMEISQNFEAHPETKEKIAILNNEIIAKREELERAKEYENNIQRAEAILEKYKSPFKGLGEIIVRRAEECGGDFRTLLAIAGNESGFGRIPYKLYNPFGYLDGKQYSGWNESLEFLSCVISQRFIAPCKNDIECIVRTYGGSDTDKPKWVYNINWFRNQI